MTVDGQAEEPAPLESATLSAPLTAEINPTQLRLLARVARMYHERGLLQPQIAAELHISQSRVSRLLRQAANLGVVRTVVSLPNTLYTDLEMQLRDALDLLDVVVVDATGASSDVTPALGAATATYLSETLTGGDSLGISSWSATLLAAVEAMAPKNAKVVDVVAQLLGGVGDAHVQVRATAMLDRLSILTGAQPLPMPTPAVVSTASLQKALIRDPAVADVVGAWSSLTVALVGIGSLDASPMLRQSGNAITAKDREALQAAGAVGDVCLRFFDPDGKLVDAPIHDRVLGITSETLKRIPRRIGVAGGPAKFSAIRAAARGAWINILITDLETARHLLSETS